MLPSCFALKEFKTPVLSQGKYCIL